MDRYMEQGDAQSVTSNHPNSSILYDRADITPNTLLLSRIGPRQDSITEDDSMEGACIDIGCEPQPVFPLSINNSAGGVIRLGKHILSEQWVSPSIHHEINSDSDESNPSYSPKNLSLLKRVVDPPYALDSHEPIKFDQPHPEGDLHVEIPTPHISAHSIQLRSHGAKQDMPSSVSSHEASVSSKPFHAPAASEAGENELPNPSSSTQGILDSGRSISNSPASVRAGIASEAVTMQDTDSVPSGHNLIQEGLSVAVALHSDAFTPLPPHGKIQEKIAPLDTFELRGNPSSSATPVIERSITLSAFPDTHLQSEVPSAASPFYKHPQPPHNPTSVPITVASTGLTEVSNTNVNVVSNLSHNLEPTNCLLIAELDSTKRALGAITSQLAACRSSAEVIINNLSAELHFTKCNLTGLSSQLHASCVETCSLRDEVSSSWRSIQDLQCHLQGAAVQIQDKDRQLQSAASHIREIESQLRYSDERNREIEGLLRHKEDQLRVALEARAQCEEQLERSMSSVHALRADIQGMQNQISQHGAFVTAKHFDDQGRPLIADEFNQFPPAPSQVPSYSPLEHFHGHPSASQSALPRSAVCTPSTTPSPPPPGHNANIPPNHRDIKAEDGEVDLYQDHKFRSTASLSPPCRSPPGGMLPYDSGYSRASSTESTISDPPTRPPQDHGFEGATTDRMRTSAPFLAVNPITPISDDMQIANDATSVPWDNANTTRSSDADSPRSKPRISSGAKPISGRKAKPLSPSMPHTSTTRERLVKYRRRSSPTRFCVAPPARARTMSMSSNQSENSDPRPRLSPASIRDRGHPYAPARALRLSPDPMPASQSVQSLDVRKLGASYRI
ncbi:hypothetical protein HWV62_43559 [Athelia sp. TMB]|nr:hypothetical protein HWV62_43559 [Athelia sp. TMB]